jgi:hypothetical protein
LTVFFNLKKKMNFFSCFWQNKLAISQLKRTQIKKKKVSLESAKAKLQNKTKKLYF